MEFRDKTSGEPFAARLGRLWEARGVEPEKRGYWSAWVMKFGKFLAPRRYSNASLADVEAFYAQLAGEGRAHWQVEQADGALKGLYQGMYPMDWAQPWQPKWPEAVMTQLHRGPTRDSGQIWWGAFDSKMTDGGRDCGAELVLERKGLNWVSPAPTGI